MQKHTTVHLVRHGAVENPHNVYYGRLPGFPLSEEGRKQAAAVGRFLRERPIATIYAGPQLRAQQTARVIRQTFQQPPPLITEPLIDEVYTPYDGVTQANMDRRGWDFYTGAPEQFEQPGDVLTRMTSFLLYVRRKYAGQEVIAVSHADPIVFYWMKVLGIPPHPDRRRLLDQYGLDDDYPAKASISTFHFETDNEDERPLYEYLRPYD